MSKRTIGRVALAAALSLGASSCVNLDSFFFNPTRLDAYTYAYRDAWPADRRVPAELRTELELPTTPPEGSPYTTYAAMVRRPGDEARTAPTVLYHHGNARHYDAYWDRVSLLWSMGCNVLVYDYPGYGRTPGTPNEAGIYASARAARAHLTSLGNSIDQSRIFHYGFSLGSAPATELASTESSAGLVLEAPFTSVAGLAADSSLIAPSSFFMTNTFDNRAKIGRAATRARRGVLIFHGTIDDFVQTHFGEQLDRQIMLDANTRPHRLVLVEGANHGDVPCAVRPPPSGTGCVPEPDDGSYMRNAREFLLSPAP